MEDRTSSLAIDAARRVVGRLIEARRTAEPPFPAWQYARLVGVRDIVQADLGDLDALLLPLKDGWRIKVNERCHPLRQNFSIAHEIGHILLQEALSERPTYSMRGATPQEPAHDVKERICNMIASELLMPRAAFGKALHAIGLSVDAIPLLAKAFWTSVPSTAIRIVEVSEEACVSLYWRLIVRPGSRHSRPCLLWASRRGSIESPPQLPRSLTVSRRTSVFEAFLSNSAVSRFDSFPLGENHRPFYIESRAFGSSGNRYVISLLFPTRKKPSSMPDV